MAGEMLWLVECPFQDQGLVRPLVTSSGGVVLMCDEGGEVWLHTDDVSRETTIVPDRPDWRVADGIDIMPGTTRWASRSDLEAVGLEVQWRT